MPVSSPAHLATIHRGTALEAVIRGHVAVVDAAGELVASAGDPAAVTTLRSCAKPIQALPLVRHAAGPLGLGDEEIAIACASHSGEAVHVEVVSKLLTRIGFTEAELTCGPQLPMDDAAAEALLAAGLAPNALTNNCSGKHAGMLAVCVARGWPTIEYASAQHPLQEEIRVIMGELGGLDLSTAPVGVDGCGLPTYGLPLHFLARMFAAASSDSSFRRCQDAMTAHPYLVAGRGRFDTAVLEVAGKRVTVKGGAAGVWVGVRRPAGPGLAIKLEAGDQSAISVVALAAMERLGWLGPDELRHPQLAGPAHPVLRNWAGTEVGRIDAEDGWLR